MMEFETPSKLIILDSDANVKEFWVKCKAKHFQNKKSFAEELIDQLNNKEDKHDRAKNTGTGSTGL